MSSQPPESPQGTSTTEPPGEALRHRRRRRRQMRLLGGVVAFWVLMGLALYVVEWPTEGSSDVPHSGGTWVEIRPVPLSERQGTAAAWADDRLVVWGGHASEESGSGPATAAELRTDGAVWKPSGEWVDMAPPPGDLALGVGGFAEWTGEEVVFGPAVPADPADAAPIDRDTAEGSGASEDGAVPLPEAAAGLLGYNPQEDSWRTIELSGVELAALRTDDAEWDVSLVDGELILSQPDASAAAPGEGPEPVAIDPATGQARTLPAGPFAVPDGPDGRETVRLASAGDHLVATTHGEGPEAWLLNLSQDDAEWVQGAPPPAEYWSNPREVRRLGAGDVRGLDAGDQRLLLHQRDPLIHDVADDSWASPEEEPPILHTELGTEYVWTGEAALAAGQVYDPEADSWGEIPELPLEDGDHLSQPYVAWTGDAMVVFGGQLVPQCPEETSCAPDETQPDDLRGWIYVN